MIDNNDMIVPWWSDRVLAIPYVFYLRDAPNTDLYTLSYTTLFRSQQGRALRAAELHLPGLHHLAEDVDVDHRLDRDVDQRLRSEEHTSELQSRFDLVCRLLLEKKKIKLNNHQHVTNY